MLIFSSSGLRGIAPEWLTPEIALRAAVAYARTLNPDAVLVGRDTRSTSPLLELSVVSGLLSEGVKVFRAGIVPTPIAFFAVRELGLDGAIVITGSHNPVMWNALKMANEEGTFIKDEVMKKIIDALREVRCGWKSGGEAVVVDVIERYVQFLKGVVDCEVIRKRGLKVLIDPAAGAASHVTPRVLREVGCKVVSVNTCPYMSFRHYEPSQETLAYLHRILRTCDIGFAHDCDGDRLVILDPRRGALDPNYTLALALESFHDKYGYKGFVVVNFATSNMVRDVAESLGCKVIYSKIGEVYVLEEMRHKGALIGGEGSSAGVIFLRLNPTRDGILTSLMILEFLARERIDLGEKLEEYPRYYSFHEKIPLDTDAERLTTRIYEDLANSFEVEVLDGIKVSLDEGWVLFRPSRTEPYMRVIGEAIDEERVKELKRWGVKLVRDIMREMAR